MEGNTNFSRRMKQFDGLTSKWHWLPISYESLVRSATTLVHVCGMLWNSISLPPIHLLFSAIAIGLTETIADNRKSPSEDHCSQSRQWVTDSDPRPTTHWKTDPWPIGLTTANFAKFSCHRVLRLKTLNSVGAIPSTSKPSKWTDFHFLSRWHVSTIGSSRAVNYLSMKFALSWGTSLTSVSLARLNIA